MGLASSGGELSRRSGVRILGGIKRTQGAGNFGIQNSVINPRPILKTGGV